MINATIITLIADDPAAHGVFDATTPTETTVMAEAYSVGMTESYAAHSAGLKPEIKFRLTISVDYHGEKRLRWEDTLYRIIRTYVNGDGIELTCERWDSDV